MLAIINETENDQRFICNLRSWQASDQSGEHSQNVLKQFEKDAEEDEEIYDQLACWCEVNDKGKTQSIADAETKIKDPKGAR